MGKQLFNIKGMIRDLDPAKTPNQYAYEIRNLRLTAQEDSTLLSLTTEKGNTQYTLTNTIEGDIIGYCTVNKYLTIFTHVNSSTTDHIYRLEETTGSTPTMSVTELYTGDLGFGETGIRLETLGVFENENIIKVYWIDEVHQLRAINIMTGTVITDNVKINSVPTMRLREQVEVEKTNTLGTFNSGTIQYFLYYYNKHGNQSAIFQQTPLFYISPNNRGGSPEELVANSFKIKIRNFDTNFDFIRVVSAYRSSQNGTPVYKLVSDIPTNTSNTVTEIDTEISFVQDLEIDVDSLTQTQDQSVQIYKAHTVAYLDMQGHIHIEELMDEEVPLYAFLDDDEANTYYVQSGGIQSSEGHAIYIQRTGYIIYLHTGKFYNGEEVIQRIWGAPIGNPSEYIQFNVKLKLVATLDSGTNLLKYTITNVTGNKVVTPGTFSTMTVTTEIQELSTVDSGLGEIIDNFSVFQSYPIVPKTMERKEGTLFLGNYSYHNAALTEEEKETIKSGCTINYFYKDALSTGSLGGYYPYDNELDLSNEDITTFKGGETYHFGIVLQDNLGVWTSVVEVGSATNKLYPLHSRTSVYLVQALLSFSTTAQEILNRYKRIKVVTLDRPQQKIIAQGALCPTIFNKNRKDNSPYAQSSWFFRSVTPTNDASNVPQNKNFGNIKTSTTADIGEVQGASSTGISYYDQNPDSLEETDMFLDWNTLTFHSPDIQFENITSFTDDVRMRIVGILPMTSGITSHTLTLASPTRGTAVFDWLNNIINYSNSTDGVETQLASFCIYDKKWNTDDFYYYQLFPWQRETSLTAQPNEDSNNAWYAQPDIKVFGSLRSSSMTQYLQYITNVDYQDYEITQPVLCGGLNNSILVPSDTNNSNFALDKLYIANVDTALTNNTGYPIFGKISGSVSTLTSACKDPIRMKYKSDTHAVFALKTIGNEMFILPNVESNPIGSASINTDAMPYTVVTSLQGVIQLSDYSYSENANNGTLTVTIPSNHFSTGDLVYIESTSYRYNDIWKVDTVSGDSVKFTSLDRNFYNQYKNLGAYDTQLPYYDDVYGTSYYYETISDPSLAPGYFYWDPEFKSYYKVYYWYFYYVDTTNSEIQYYKYKYYIQYYAKGAWGPNNAYHFYSGDYTELYVSHSELLRYTQHNYGSTLLKTTLEDTEAIPPVLSLAQKSLTINSPYHYVYLAELYYDAVPEDNIDNSRWIPAGISCPISSMVIADIGDTYFQRYDCLKTSPYTLEDHNQITEVFSFMCETKVNIDGRYDVRRGQSNNTTLTQENFNLLNKTYTQSDNIMSFAYLDSEDYSIDDFANQITWTLTKTYGEDIDSWTRLNLIATLDMDGVLGEITSLKLWNNHLLCFQDRGIARIMYNERTTMTTQQGVPVEIANSGKVDGSDYISNQIGCSNKDSIQVTQEGIYFIDNNTREIYRWSKGIESLSKGKGFNTYLYDKNVNILTEKTFYDPNLRDVYFRFTKQVGVIDNTPIYKTETLVYNEQLAEFTSFFDYDMKFMFLLKDSLISVKNNNLWKQFEGDYLSFFGDNQGYSIDIISSEQPTEDKIFSTVEFRAEVLDDKIQNSNSQATDLNSNNILPFTKIRAWNEYQDTGTVNFEKVIRRGAGANLAQKFRIWRGDIPRVNGKPLERIRNPWARISLSDEGSNKKTVVHDIAVTYF